MTPRARTILLAMMLGLACVLGGSTLTTLVTENVDGEDTSEAKSEIQSRKPRRIIERIAPDVIVERWTTKPEHVAPAPRVRRLTTRSLALEFSARRLI